ncbi:hypothetical protein BU15DRAFT_34867, partial [Melanogaster broomeanus]
ILVGFDVDVDTVAGWYGFHLMSPLIYLTDLFAGEVGVPRLLKLFNKYGLETTLFIPRRSLQTFPKEIVAVRDVRHEIGLHGYSLGACPMYADCFPVDLHILVHTYKLLQIFNSRKPPTGSAAALSETCTEGAAFPVRKDVEY